MDGHPSGDHRSCIHPHTSSKPKKDRSRPSQSPPGIPVILLRADARPTLVGHLKRFMHFLGGLKGVLGSQNAPAECSQNEIRLFHFPKKIWLDFLTSWTPLDFGFCIFD